MCHEMYRQCSEVVDHQAPAAGTSSSPYHFTVPEASNCQDLLGLLSHQDNSRETSDFRGDLPPKKARSLFPPGFDDSGHSLLDESTIGSQGYFTGSTADYSSYSYRSKIATFSSGISEVYTKPAALQRANFKGKDDETDNKPLSINKKIVEHSLELPSLGYSTQTAVYRNQAASFGPKSHDEWKSHLQSTKHDKIIKSDKKDERKFTDYYKKATYAVLIGNTVRVCNTKLYASLPLCNKYMVKEKIKDASGNARVKLSLKTFYNRLVSIFTKHEFRRIYIFQLLYAQFLHVQISNLHSCAFYTVVTFAYVCITIFGF